jgi:hypothetical protein|tara:strand:- start:229 stop:498 length:270 start_codon:yes stop_codon:yes gene_type:complete
MMSENDLETMYNKLTELSQSKDFEVTDENRTVALFRVGIEYGAANLGFPTMVFLISKMLTTSLGIMSSDETETFEDALNEFKEYGQIRH